MWHEKPHTTFLQLIALLFIRNAHHCHRAWIKFLKILQTCEVHCLRNIIWPMTGELWDHAGDYLNRTGYFFYFKIQLVHFLFVRNDLKFLLFIMFIVERKPKLNNSLPILRKKIVHFI